MTKTAPLDEQIVSVLTTISASEQAATVLTEAEAVLRDLIKQADAADVASLSPLATAAEARKLRDQASEHRFEADRMEASVSALSARVADLKDAERQARQDADRIAALKVRDELAADIAADYPRIVAELTALAKRIEETDRLCNANGIGESAEAIGRGVPPNFYHSGAPVMRIGEIKLPMPGSSRLAFEFADYAFQPGAGGGLGGAAGGRVWRGLELAAETEAA